MSTSDNQRQEAEEIVPSSSKKTIRFFEEEGSADQQQLSSAQNLNRSMNTSRGVSDSTHDDDMDFEDGGSEESRFKHIKRIDKVFSTGEGRISEHSSPSSRKMDKSGFASGEENLSVHFGGEEFIDQDGEDGESNKFEYEPDDVPLKSILKQDLNRSRNISFDVRILKDIEGKLISHENLSDKDDEDNDDDEEEGKNTQSILKDPQLMEQFVSGISSNEDSDEDEGDFLEDFGMSKEHRDSVRFKIAKEEDPLKQADPLNQKRNSLLFPAYSILKNSPLVQPSEFKALKNIEKVSHTNNKYNIDSGDDSDEQVDSNQLHQKEQNQEDVPDVRFVGDIILQDSNAYKYKYNPEENPKRPSIKRGSCHQASSLIVTSPSNNLSNNGSSRNNTSGIQLQGKDEKLTRKRKSYDFNNLKNVEGKMIKHWENESEQPADSQIESAALEDFNSNERDIKFGGFEILEQTDEDPAKEVNLSVNRTARPQKPILKPLHNSNSSGHGRSSSCDFKRAIKNIDGVYIRKNRKTTFSQEEEEKIVHFSVQIAPELTTSPIIEPIRIIEHDKTSKKSILKRSMSLQGRQRPNMLVSKESSPTHKKSSFASQMKFDGVKDQKDTPTPETFAANWTSIRNDYIESAYKFLTRVDPLNLAITFPKGIDDATFNQIIDVIHSKLGENGEFVKNFVQNLVKIKNFSSLIITNPHLSESIHEILLSLRSSHLIENQVYQKLKSLYILQN